MIPGSKYDMSLYNYYVGLEGKLMSHMSVVTCYSLELQFVNGSNNRSNNC